MGKILLATSRRCIVLQRAMIHRWGARLHPAAWLSLLKMGLVELGFFFLHLETSHCQYVFAFISILMGILIYKHWVVF